MNDLDRSYRNKKYQSDEVFNQISKRFLTVDRKKSKIVNFRLKNVIEKKFIKLMKDVDPLFADTYNQKIVFGGSYYKGTKYGDPDEFDLIFVIKLPIEYHYLKIETNCLPGYIKIKINKQDPVWLKHNEKLSRFVTKDNYFDQNEFRFWMESVFAKAFERFNGSLNLRNGYRTSTYERPLRQRKSGPAFTMIINTPENTEIHVDLVPCLEFPYSFLNNSYQPADSNLSYRHNWFAVPKPIDNNVLWRVCFYSDERDLLKGQAKPVIRMLKKYRTKMGWEKTIASYFIETIFYHEIHYQKLQGNLEHFLKSSHCCLFMHGLKKLKEALENKEIPYFWHHRHNLMGKIGDRTLENFANCVARSIKNIENNMKSNPYVIADEVLTDLERLQLN